MTKDEFIDECRFAKVVRCGASDAVLIGGEVFFFHGPMENDGETALDRVRQSRHVDWLVAALRSLARDDPMMAAGIGNQNGL